MFSLTQETGMRINRNLLAVLAVTAFATLAAPAAFAQVPQYGPNVTQDQAHKAILQEPTFLTL